MLASSARVVPHIMRAWRSSVRGFTVIWLPSTVASIWSVSSSLSSPRLPLAVSRWPAIATCTPCGISTGYLPTRDIAASPSEHAAEDFAADIGSARLGVAHHAAWRGQDRDAEAGVDPLQLLDLRIHAAARLGDAGDLLDDRLALVVLQLDAKLRNAGAQFLGHEAADEPFALEHVQHIGAQLGGRRHAHGMVGTLRIADACQHIAQGIGIRHLPVPSLTSSP